MKNKSVLILLMSALICGGVFSYFASSEPDGLEKVASENEFIETAKENTLGFIADYAVPVENEFLSVFLAGVFGVLLTFGLVFTIYKCFI